MNNISSLLWNYTLFLDSIFNDLEKIKIDVSNFELDHICYRVSSNLKYDYLKNELINYGSLLTENIISGRKISTFKLEEPIIYKNRKISILEIPSPKKWSDYKDWFEHVEFVIDLWFTDFMNKYSNIGFITKDLSKENNPDIKIKFSNYSVKFHHDSLENVINNEMELL